MLIPRAVLVVAWLLVIAASVAAQANPIPSDNATLDDENLAGEESVEGAPGIVYYVVIAAMSLAVFIALAVLSSRYRRDRGSRPPP